MKSNYIISFKDVFEASDENEAIEQFFNYLDECVRQRDVTAFDFKKSKNVLEDGFVERDENGICDEIKITWSIEDVLQQAENDGIEITREEAGDVLELLLKNHDASNGISWDTLDYYIGEVISERVKK